MDSYTITKHTNIRYLHTQAGRDDVRYKRLGNSEAQVAITTECCFTPVLNFEALLYGGTAVRRCTAVVETSDPPLFTSQVLNFYFFFYISIKSIPPFVGIYCNTSSCWGILLYHMICMIWYLMIMWYHTICIESFPKKKIGAAASLRVYLVSWWYSSHHVFHFCWFYALNVRRRMMDTAVRSSTRIQTNIILCVQKYRITYQCPRRHTHTNTGSRTIVHEITFLCIPLPPSLPLSASFTLVSLSPSHSFDEPYVIPPEPSFDFFFFF